VESEAAALDMAGSFASVATGFTGVTRADDRRRRDLRLVALRTRDA
jgi:hypothetical protein